MKKFILNATAAVCLGLALPASAATITVVEPINVAATPGETELSFKEDFSTTMFKTLKLDVTAQFSTPVSSPLPLEWYFDYTDETGKKFTTTPTQVFVSPTGSTSITGQFVIDFCPPEVSVHFTNPESVTINIVGTFTHTCEDKLRSVPDGGAYLPFMGMLVMGHICHRWRRALTK